MRCYWLWILGALCSSPILTAGQVYGTVNGEQIDVRVESQTFSALLSLTTRGDRQSISIKAPSGSRMSEASITLKRS